MIYFTLLITIRYMLPDKCAIIRNNRQCPNPPQFVVSVVSGDDEYMVGVACSTHKTTVSDKVTRLQSDNKIPQGSIRFVNLHPVGTDCIRADPDDRIQIDPLD